ncbi:MAG: tyrosine-type recombinase/integrase [Syntrophaceae bacterium]
MESSLRQFARYAAEQGLATCSLSQELVSAFCERHPGETPKSQANRCSNVRQFAMFLNANRFKAFVPDGHYNRRSDFTPYIFTHEEIARIFKAVDAIKPHARYNCSVVYQVLFRMLYGCGLRVSEALNLRVHDIDLDAGVLTIRNGKFNKSRLVVMSESLTEACAGLMKKIHLLADGEDFFFKNRDGSRRDKGTASDRFREILWESGIPYRGKGFGPRLHDVRHCFCCHSLKQMSDAGIDMYCALPVLSTYIGHSSITATERYLRLTEEFYPDVSAKVMSAAPKVYPEVYMIEAN